MDDAEKLAALKKRYAKEGMDIRRRSTKLDASKLVSAYNDALHAITDDPTEQWKIGQLLLPFSVERLGSVTRVADTEQLLSTAVLNRLRQSTPT